MKQVGQIFKELKSRIRKATSTGHKRNLQNPYLTEEPDSYEKLRDHEDLPDVRITSLTIYKQNLDSGRELILHPLILVKLKSDNPTEGHKFMAFTLFLHKRIKCDWQFLPELC